MNIVTQVATDNYGGGKEAAAAVIEALGESGGPIAVFAFQTSRIVPIASKRIHGSNRCSQRQWQSKNRRGRRTGKRRCKGLGIQSDEDALQSNPEIRAIFAINDPAALGLSPHWRKLESNNRSLSSALMVNPKENKRSKKAKFMRTRSSFPTRWVFKSLTRSYDIPQGETLPPQMLIPTKLYRKADAESDPELK